MFRKIVQPHNILIFIMRQLKQFHESGWPVRKRKLKFVYETIVRLPVLLIAFVPALLVVLTARLVSPVFLIRFQRLISWRIGHFAGNTELYLCELDVGINRPEIPFLDIWYYPCAPCNQQLARMWNRVLDIGPAILFGLVDRLNAMIPGGEIHRIGENIKDDRDVRNLLDLVPPHLSFLPDEEKLGEAGLRSLGVPENSPFVCLIVRDSAYLSDQNSQLDWTRHDYRDCDIQNYILAARKLVKRGYYVIRMGVVVKEAMDVNHPMIIDYAANGVRNDFMDIYLGAKCTFCISTTTGFDAVPWSFRRPMVYVDCSPLGIIRTNSPNYISTSKKYWLREEKRLMSFREIFDSGAGYFTLSSEYDDMGIELMESTPEEIAAVVLEMEERLKGTWRTTDEDEELQLKFWEIFPKNEWHGEIRSRIGADFLRRHKGELE